MRHERATEDVRQQASLYALGLLTQHEARGFELHMADCGVCRNELEQLEHAVAKIGLAVKEATPPEELKIRLEQRLDQIVRPLSLKNIRQAQPLQIVRSAPTSSVMPLPLPALPEKVPEDADSGQPPVAVLQFSLPSTSGKSLIIIGLVIFSLGCVLAATFALYSRQILIDDNMQLRSRMEAADIDVAGAREQLARQQVDVEEMEKISNLMASSDVRIARLKGQSRATDNAAVFFWNVPAMECTLVGSFSPLPEGKVYQIWLSTQTRRISIGFLAVDDTKRILAIFPLAQDPANAASVVISIEPEGGSPAPTGAFAAIGHLD